MAPKARQMSSRAERTIHLANVFASPSFRAQSDDWIDAGRAPGRQPRSHEGNSGDEQNDGNERRRIRGADSEEKAGQQASSSKGSDEPHCQTNADERHGL